MVMYLAAVFTDDISRCGGVGSLGRKSLRLFGEPYSNFTLKGRGILWVYRAVATANGFNCHVNGLKGHVNN